MTGWKLKWIGLLAVLGIMVIVLAFIIPVVIRARASAHRVQCAENLRKIGQALAQYSNANKGLYPKTRWKPADVTTPLWGTGAAAKDPFADDGPEFNDVSAALFLLVRQGYVGPEVFVCPGRGGKVDKFDGGAAATRSNFTDVRRNLNYSYENLYSSTRTHIPTSGWKFNISMDNAVAADLNPGIRGPGDNVQAVKLDSPPEVMSLGNSNNHRKAGQNVLFLDGRVEWKNNPFVGPDRDNIYTASDGNGGNTAVFLEASWGSDTSGHADNFLLPTDD